MDNRKKLAIALFVIFALEVSAVIGISLNKSKNKTSVQHIGVLMPLTGLVAEPGKNCLRGIQLAVAQYNNINPDHAVDLVIEDSKAEPSFAVSAVQKLISVDSVPAILGDLTSSVSMSVAPITEKAGVILIAPGASHPKFTGIGPHTFRVWVSDNFDGEIMAHYLSEDRGLKKGAVLYVNTDYGVGLASVFKEKFENAGGQILFIEGYMAGTTDFRPTIEKLKALTELQFVYLPGNPKENGFFVRQASEAHFSGLLAANLSVENEDFEKAAGSAMRGIVFSSPSFDPNRPTMDGKPFIGAYRPMFEGSIPDIASAHGYDAALALLVGWTNAAFDWSKTPKAIASIKGLQGMTGTIDFTPQGDIRKSILIKELQSDGTAITLKEVSAQ